MKMTWKGVGLVAVLWGVAAMAAVGCGATTPGSDAPEVAGELLAKAKRPPPAIPGAKEAFAEVLRLVREQYVDADLSEDALWTGAIEGVLGRLIQLHGFRVNALLAPSDLKELEVGLRGRLSGVGAVLKKLEGEVLMVRDVIPGAPAAEAGLRAGDRVLAIDGAKVRGMTMRTIVDRIRGPEGSTVRLMVQRDDREWEQPLTRRAFTVASLQGTVLPGGVGYLRLRELNRTTVAALDAQLAAFRAKGVGSLVLDLRVCGGGLFETALQVAERFLRQGDRIVTLRKREGKEEVKTAAQVVALDQVPMAVLLSHKTASGAEIIAAALRDNGRATLVGERTAGKGTVERVLKLPAGWGLKLSVARFLAPKGGSWLRTGLTPDFPIATPKGMVAPYSVKLKVSLDEDAPLRTALSVLALRAGTTAPARTLGKGKASGR